MRIKSVGASGVVVVALHAAACAGRLDVGRVGDSDGSGGSSDGGTAAETSRYGADAPLDGEEDAGETADVQDDAPSTDDAPAYDAANCDTAGIDSLHGIFVALGGTDGVACGTIPTNPCQSIGAGIASAAHVDAGVRNIVYVAAGLYTEKLTLVGGVTVQGGWHWDGGPRWSFDCGNAPESVVVVQAPSDSYTTVDASSNDGVTTALSTLTVLSKAASAVQPGESLYGVFATGVNTVLALTDVVVTVQGGGAGQAGATGGAGSTAPGPCAVGDGASATIPGAEGTAGSEGTLSSTGFTTLPAGTGANGVAGDDGAAGGAPTSVTYSACASVNPCTVEQATCAGGYGVNGCGGGGGLGGGGGVAGGSSVALFAYDATVTVTAGALRAGNGGNGGAGGAGGTGGAGSAGATGEQTSCEESSCSDSGACVPGESVTASGGPAGTAGGQGSPGGQGGGGAGGDSYAIVTGGQATEKLSVVDSPALTPGKAGTGGVGNGPSGTALVQGVF
ncbi:MAG: hypothetical protein ACLP1X_06020 [Polyangiaceae bacterium]|jgi:hypothetical protein